VSQPHKRTTAQVWQAVEGLAADEAELRRIDALSDEELDRELREAGTTPEEAAKVGKGLLASGAGKEQPPYSTAARARRRWTVWLVAATLGAIAITLAAMNGAAIVAWFHPGDDIRPDDRGLTWPNEVARARAEKLRDEADKECQMKLWGACEARLDEAMKLDPGGESEERVR